MKTKSIKFNFTQIPKRSLFPQSILLLTMKKFNLNNVLLHQHQKYQMSFCNNKKISNNRSDNNRLLNNLIYSQNLSKKPIYYTINSSRNEEFLFNYGINSIALEYQNDYQLKSLKSLLLRFKYRHLIKSLNNKLHTLFNEIASDNPNLEWIKSILENNLYELLIKDLAYKKESIAFLNKYEPSKFYPEIEDNKIAQSEAINNRKILTKIFISPININYLFGAEIDRSKNSHKVEGLLNEDNKFYYRNQIYKDEMTLKTNNKYINNNNQEKSKHESKKLTPKDIKPNYFNVHENSNKLDDNYIIQKNNQTWKEIIKRNPYSTKDYNLINYNNVMNNEELKTQIINDLRKELENEYCDNYIYNELKRQPTEKEMSIFYKHIELHKHLNSDKLISKFSNKEKILRKSKFEILKKHDDIEIYDLTTEQEKWISFFKSGREYIDNELNQINLYDYFRVKFPKDYEKMKIKEKTLFKQVLISIYDLNAKSVKEKVVNKNEYEHPIVIIDFLIQSKRRIINRSDLSAVEFNAKNDKNNSDESKEIINEINKKKKLVYKIYKEDIDKYSLNDYEWNYLDNEFIQKHVVRVEFKSKDKLTSIFNKETDFIITDIDFSLDGNPHFKF